MIICGIDPGIATTGIAVVEQQGHKFISHYYGVIRTKAHTPLPDRLELLSKGVKNVLDQFSPQVVSVEELFFNTNVKTALTVGQARGVILLTAKQSNVDVVSYTPPQVKSSVCGYGKAAKTQVQYMVKKLLNLDVIPKPDDAADALALAICHGHSHKIKSLT